MNHLTIFTHHFTQFCSDLYQTFWITDSAQGQVGEGSFWAFSLLLSSQSCLPWCYSFSNTFLLIPKAVRLVRLTTVHLFVLDNNECFSSCSFFFTFLLCFPMAWAFSIHHFFQTFRPQLELAFQRTWLHPFSGLC